MSLDSCAGFLVSWVAAVRPPVTPEPRSYIT